jgi:hypothetical protein
MSLQVIMIQSTFCVMNSQDLAGMAGGDERAAPSRLWLHAFSGSDAAFAPAPGLV